MVAPRVQAAQWRGPAIAARGGPLRGFRLQWPATRLVTSRAAGPRSGTTDVVATNDTWLPLRGTGIRYRSKAFFMKPSINHNNGARAPYGWRITAESIGVRYSAAAAARQTPQASCTVLLGLGLDEQVDGAIRHGSLHLGGQPQWER